MAYGDDIDALLPSHTYSFDGNANDGTSTLDGSNSGCIFTEAGICEGAVNCMTTNGISDDIDVPDSVDINTAAQTQMALAGWFEATAIQNPPKRIAGIGGDTAMQILLGWGNALMFEAISVGAASYGPLQVYGDNVLTAGRKYHLCAVWQGNANGNEFRCYLDGVKQLSADPVNRQPGVASHDSAGQGLAFGNISADSYYTGGVLITTLSPINGRYNEWAWWNGTNANLTDTEIREELFEKGALPDVTITNQAGLDALASTVRANAPCCIRVTGSGTINLTADNVTFDPLASIHVQYTGTGTVNWTNTNGANASIGSVTNGGTINFINPAQLTLNNLDNPTEIRVYEAGTQTEVAGQEAVTTGTFTDTIGVAAVDIALISLSKKIFRIENVGMGTNQTINVVQFNDRNYVNP